MTSILSEQELMPLSEDYLPQEYEVHEEDLIRYIDISKPNSLATNKSTCNNTELQKSYATYKMPLYNVGDVVVLIDPVSSYNVHGKILSEWDFRHGTVAPTILRGDGSLAWYVVEIKGLMSEVADYASLTRDRVATPPTLSFPVLSGLTDSSLRKENELAKNVALKVREVRNLQKYGPRDHFMGKSKSQSRPISRPGTGDPEGSGTDPSVEEDADSAGVVAAPERREWSTIPKLKTASRHATQRGLADALGLSAVTGNNYSKKDIKRFLRVIVVPENELVGVGDQHKLLMHQKFVGIRILLQNLFTHMIENDLRWALSKWYDELTSYKAYQKSIAAIRVQSIIRMFLCKNIIPNSRAEWQQVLYHRWRRVQDKFSICRNPGQNTLTVNQKIHFNKMKDIQQYYRISRMILTNLSRFLNKQRMILLTKAMNNWHKHSDNVLKSTMLLGHWRVDHVAAEDLTREVPRSEVEQRAERSFRQLKSALESGKAIKHCGISISDHDYDNIVSLPLALQRDSSGAKAAPPSDPSSGISLPPLMAVPATQGKDGSAEVLPHNRPKFNSYRKLMAGPIDSASWVIPNMLLMGGAPYGKGRKKNWKNDSTETSAKDSLSMLVLSGISCVVSLLTPREEEELEKQFQVDAVRTTLQPTSIAAKKALRDVIFSLKCQRDTDQTKLDVIPPLSPSHPEFAAYKKERRKRIAKITNTSLALERATVEMTKVPQSVSWTRLSLEPDSEANHHEVLPIIWAIESLLAKGERVYVYSRDGLDRAPLICGCILGRLYGLSHTEALFRLQVHLNSAPQHVNAMIPINCPQSQSHRRTLRQVLIDSNRIYDPVICRSQVDPETYILKHEMRRKVIEPKKEHLSTLSRLQAAPLPPCPPTEYRPHRGVYQNHDVFEEQVVTPSLLSGRGESIPVRFSGGKLCKDFYIDSEKLLTEPPKPTEKTLLPLIRRNNVNRALRE